MKIFAIAAVSATVSAKTGEIKRQQGKKKEYCILERT